MVTHEDVYRAMVPGESYTAGDLVDEGEFDVTTRTIYDKLRVLHAADRIERKKHSSGSVTWKIPIESCPECGYCFRDGNSDVSSDALSPATSD